MQNLIPFPNDAETWGPQGVLASINETESTNQTSNSGMVGAIPGTPGTLPTNWATTDAGSSISTQVIGTGYDSGMPYLDLRFFGVATAGAFRLQPDFSIMPQARPLDYRSMSFYAKMVAGSTAQVGNPTADISFRTVNNFVPTQNPQAQQFAALGASFFRYTSVAQASTAVVAGDGNNPVARVRGELRFNFTAGAVDITVRIAGVQLEPGAVPSSFMPTFGAQVTRIPLVSPSGSGPMDRIIEDTTNGAHAIAVTGLIASGTQVSGLIYVRPAGRTVIQLGANLTSGVIIDLVSGKILSNSATAGSVGRVRQVERGIWLIELIKFNTGGGQGIYATMCDTLGNNTYIGDGQSGMYVWGFSLFLGPETTLPYAGTASFTGGWYLAEMGRERAPEPEQPRKPRGPTPEQLRQAEIARQITARRAEIENAQTREIGRAQRLFGSPQKQPANLRLPKTEKRNNSPKLIRFPKD